MSLLRKLLVMRLLLKIISAIILLAICLLFYIRALYSPNIVLDRNDLCFKQKYLLTNYLDDRLLGDSIPPKIIVVVVNEEICDNNLFLAYKLISETHPNYIGVIVNTPNSRFYRPISKIVEYCNNNNINHTIDSVDNLSNIVPVFGFPLVLFCEQKRVVAGFNLDIKGYEQVNKIFETFSF